MKYKDNGGYVDKVLITTTDNEYFLIKAMVRDMRLPELGDKFSSRHGQKGVVGLITGQVSNSLTCSFLGKHAVFECWYLP